MSQPIWTTAAGSIANSPYGYPMSYLLVATPVSPATSVTYTVLAGDFPDGLSLNQTTGLISGTPSLVIENTISAFTVRATDNLNNLRDRTFTITVGGTTVPQFTTPSGELISNQDSIWTQIQIQYSNPDVNNPVEIKLQQGILPPGIELASNGLLQGYPNPPIISVNLSLITASGLSTDSTTDYITCSLSLAGVILGRPVTFTSPIGGIEAGVTYYVKYIDAVSNSFSISITQNGDTIPLITATGAMTITFSAVSSGDPIARTYNFALQLVSPLGNDIQTYSITVLNQALTNPPNTRNPTLLNTRPLTIQVTDVDPYHGYYVLPPVAPSENAQMGTFLSDNFFSFKLIGYDFDGNDIEYICSGLPLGITFNSVTGWLTGTPALALPGINSYTFTAQVVKTDSLSITSPIFNFGFILRLDIIGEIAWITPSDLGIIYNETLSTLQVSAVSDVDLEYRITSGSLPPNLTLLSNGEITGVVASQPLEELLSVGTSTEFSFTVQAFSTTFNIIQSSKTFNVTVYQEYGQPTDILYIEAAPSIHDRQILKTLLDDDVLIPEASLYRPTDIYFGKATSVIYQHAFGIYASNLQEYIAAVTQNHYWRNIILGELKTAVARDNNGDIIYEVVYSEVIDNLVNPNGISIESEIYWPYPINLGLGPWYTSVTNIFTSYITVLEQSYFTSLTPGFARVLYPNSLYNMRNRVGQVLGQVYNSTLLPLWMTSQQPNGSTLGYTQAWVICYTKPGFATTIKNNINNNWAYKLNQINFNIDRFTVDKSTTYDWENNLTPPAWVGLPSATPVPDPLNSQDFYVLFPRETILPDETQ